MWASSGQYSIGLPYDSSDWPGRERATSRIEMVNEHRAHLNVLLLLFDLPTLPSSTPPLALLQRMSKCLDRLRYEQEINESSRGSECCSLPKTKEK